MTAEVKIAFEQQVRVLPLNDILPTKMLPPAIKEHAKYKRIANSVAQLGLVEPLIVARQPERTWLPGRLWVAW
jgi:ParB-like chromosome segregation protein Spo0J